SGCSATPSSAGRWARRAACARGSASPGPRSRTRRSAPTRTRLPAERPAVVLGLLWAGLSFARSLGRRGVPVAGMTMHPHEFGAKVLVAQTPDQLVAQWKRAKERGFDTVVQELVPDSEEGIWSLFAYLGRSGKPLATATGVKVRQGLLHFGTSAVFRTTPEPR